MKHQLEQLIIRKEKKLNRYFTIRNQMLASIFKNSIDKKSIRDIHKDIRKISKFYGIKNSSLESFCLNVATKIKKEVKEKESMELPILVFKAYQKYDIYRESKTIIYAKVKEEEAFDKQNILENELNQNRNLHINNIDINDEKVGNPKMFYLGSSHTDCADDHKSSQGKIYYDSKWKNYVKDEKTRKIVEDVINKYGMKSFQYITYKPVWFITRPNCRHYFKALTLKDVIDNSVNQLIIKYDMHSQIGDRKYLQTIAHDMRNNQKSIKNVENIIKQYEDRLAYHKVLYEQNKLDILKKAIDKDKLLIKKWKAYLQRLKK